MKPMTIRQFFKQFPDDETCLSHIFECRFGSDYPCPKCEKHTTWHRIKAERAYSCARCGHHLHPTVGTPFEKSRTALQLWFYAIYLFTQTRHGVSAKELQRQLGVTYKCAWRMGHEIRKHMADVDDLDFDPLRGHVQIDETLLGGEGSHEEKKDRPVVLGMIEKDGDVHTVVVDSSRREHVVPHITASVEPGTVISTDGWPAYQVLPSLGFEHGVVRHNRGEYVNGIHTTNSMESYWHILKASIASTHIHVSPKHLNSYLGEFEYRHNNRKKKAATMFPELISTYPGKAG